ncbi:MAG: T9SS type A sorting domain-containing protein [Bacteroidia bacterium]|nr:T9SS type A sorting domain-containing protein [Bacteroidia bacterium]
MKIFYITFLILFCTFHSTGQVLHRQTLSNNGVSTLTKKGFFVSHTIGQPISSQTVKKATTIIQQGFQQSMFSRSGLEIDIPKLSIETKVYPNPFNSYIKIDFSEEIKSDIQVILFDMLGKILFKTSKTPENKSITLDNLDFLPAGSYFLSLNTNNYNFNNQLIKN